MKWAEQDAHQVYQRLQGYQAQLAKWFPNVWTQADSYRAMRGKDVPNWPNWCFLPMAGACGIASQPCEIKDMSPESRAGMSILISEIAALVAWRPTQGIYRFHPEVFSSLWETSVDGDIPVELLYRLPEWCCYIDCYGKQCGRWSLAGFFVHLEWDATDNWHELRILLDRGNQNNLLPLILHISSRNTIANMIASFVDESERVAHSHAIDLPDSFEHCKGEAIQYYSEIAKPLISLVLYLCSTTPEFRDSRGTDRFPVRVKPTKTKKGERIFPPDRPTIWETGYRIGGLIEQARAERYQSAGTGEGTHVSPVPHIRKPHWHSFWKGPKVESKKRELVVHWLPPIPVGYKPGEEIVPTIKPVK
jgi:hypothetical protein